MKHRLIITWAFGFLSSREWGRERRETERRRNRPHKSLWIHFIKSESLADLHALSFDCCLDLHPVNTAHFFRPHSVDCHVWAALFSPELYRMSTLVDRSNQRQSFLSLLLVSSFEFLFVLHMGVLATGAGIEGKGPKEIVFPTRENRRVLHCLCPQYPGKCVLRGFFCFYHSHVLYRVKLFSHVHSDFFLCWVTCVFCKLKFTHLHKYCKFDLFSIFN